MNKDNRRLSIKELAEEDRPREKMMLKGAFSLSDAELMAILLRVGNTDETAVQLSQRILGGVSNNLNTLGKLSVKDLMKYKGIGDAKAVTIVAAMELGRRREVSEPVKRESIRSSNDAFRLFYPFLCDIPHEELWIALTNHAGKVIEKMQISRGGLGETSADLRFIMKAAINSTCHGIILCHNHPSGNIQPSAQDDTLTSKLGKAAQLMSMQLLDHIIISDKYYYSYADEGRL
ncbi:MAG: DNA repair protein RadC [Tannerella sp.]|jgi:DNA repair protein RadC|nr:DNA repair protein RadC [Tannerella sp.]